MKLIDISQKVFSCDIYPGDPAPQRQVLSDMAEGALYNLTAFSMCAHNGTHIDAPKHFLNDGGCVEQIPLYKTVGAAYVTHHSGILDAACAKVILKTAALAEKGAEKRILIGGQAVISLAAAEVFASAGVYLIGVDTQSVGPADAPMAVHKCLLSADVVLLEGLRLADVADGTYLLMAQPLLLEGADGAPCRAVLASFDEWEDCHRG